MTISEKIEKIMLAQGRKRKWLAEQMGLSPQSITSKFKTNYWTTSEIIALNTILNVDLEQQPA